MLNLPGKCPLCGVTSKENKEVPEVKLCPRCGAIFNDFGLIFIEEEPEFWWT